MNNQMPYGFYPNMYNISDMPEMFNEEDRQCRCRGEIINLSRRITQLEKEQRRIEERIRRLENFRPTSTQFDSNNYSSDYNMM